MPRFKETNMRRGLHVGSCRYLRWRSHALHTIMYIIEYRETAKSQLSTIIICRCARPLKLFNKLSIYLPTYLSSSTGFYSTVNWHQFISLLFFFLSLLIHSWIIYIFIYLSLSFSTYFSVSACHRFHCLRSLMCVSTLVSHRLVVAMIAEKWAAQRF